MINKDTIAANVKARAEWLQWVLADHRLSAGDTRVLTALISHENVATGELAPGVARLAALTNSTPRSVKRSLHKAADLGWLHINFGGGRYRTSSYERSLPDRNVLLELQARVNRDLQRFEADKRKESARERSRTIVLLAPENTHATVRVSTKKGDTSVTLSNKKGDTTVTHSAPERVTAEAQKGDRTSTERVTDGAQKGDTSVTRTVFNNKIEQSSNSATQGDGAMNEARRQSVLAKAGIDSEAAEQRFLKKLKKCTDEAAEQQLLDKHHMTREELTEAFRMH